MLITDARVELEPMVFPQFYQYWLNHMHSQWNHTKISLAQDVYDWRFRLTPAQQAVVGHTLKGFSQVELVAGKEYWSSKPINWFPHPEIALMCMEFAAREGIHTIAYSQVDTNLDLRDYKGFLQEPTVKAKLDWLVNLKGDTDEEKAISLASFSAFTEGVSLFSQFAVLWNFSRFDLLPGIGALINYSVIDEAEHSKAGCELFRIFAAENNLYTHPIKKAIYDAARTAVQLEDDYLDKTFQFGDIPGITKHQLRQFIRARANQKLNELGMKDNWKNIDKPAFEEIDSWFTAKTVGEKDGDFFVRRAAGAYGKGNTDWSTMWEGNEIEQA